MRFGADNTDVREADIFLIPPPATKTSERNRVPTYVPMNPKVAERAPCPPHIHLSQPPHTRSITDMGASLEDDLEDVRTSSGQPP